jgi:hypothetical protein
MSNTITTDHDDGLVHPHGWACGERGREAHVNRPAPEPEHDDGLVHGHGWASAERSREAHRR